MYSERSSDNPIIDADPEDDTNEKNDKKNDTHNSSNSQSFKCFYCDYISQTRRGINIHASKMHAHQFKCEECEEQFTNSEQLKRHVECKELIASIENASFEDMKVDAFQADETCFGIFSDNQDHTADPEIPIIHLHSEECWFGGGHSCPLLPTNHSPKKRVELSMVDTVLCLHMAQSDVISCGGDYINWEMATDLIEEHL